MGTRQRMDGCNGMCKFRLEKLRGAAKKCLNSVACRLPKKVWRAGGKDYLPTMKSN